MRYNQVKDLVEWAAGFHARMARQYSEAADAAENERLQMALNYLVSRELKMKTGLEDLFHDGSDHSTVLETWFDESGEFPEPPELNRLAEQTVIGSIEDAMETATTAHQRLQSLYKHRASRAKIEPEEEFFNSLAEGHNSEIRHMMASMEELQGI
ncbi:2-hydroxyacyl-CoA dehydratase [Halomonas sp. SpR8]|uniref:2-hydroxyacyl-CoA dehydratase n=1 Tax=Halomonas sp. SpR8 TaxID=3050463 RepID=UPI0027E3C3D9|nr:2-hydroxyacyl-CoA dehydratase [Halomonas sp. SpR8]MDQ7729906.1 2-hydroxyacyl-CoA dehydratase [Halomonas sp. SpR8]